MNESITLAEVYINALIALDTHIGGEPLTAENLGAAFADPQYADKLAAIPMSVNRGLIYAELPPLPLDTVLDTDLIPLGIPYEIALALPLYVKYELYQTEDYRQALLARDDYDSAVKRYLNRDVQSEVKNVYEGYYD